MYQMLNYMKYLCNSKFLIQGCMLVNLNRVKIFPSINNKSVLQAEKNALETRLELSDQLIS